VTSEFGDGNSCKVYLFIYCMELSLSSAANYLSTSQENTRILWNPKFITSLKNSGKPVTILRKLHPVHNTKYHIFKSHLNFILTSTLGSIKWSNSFRFPQSILCIVLSYPLEHNMPRLSHSSRFYYRTLLGEKYRILSTFCSFPISLVTSSFLDLSILLKSLSSDTISQSSSRNINDQVSHSHKTTGKVIVLYVLHFNLLDSSLEDKNSAPNDKKHLLIRSALKVFLNKILKC